MTGGSPNVPRRRWLILLAWTALVGLALSVELARIHFLVHTRDSYQALCDQGGRVSCGAVALSPYSVWWGVPVAVWGVAAYFGILLLVFGARFSRDPRGTWPSGLLLLLSLGACAASLWLSILSLTRIDAICLYCNLLHLVNAFLLLFSLLHLKNNGPGVLRALAQDLGWFPGNRRALLFLLIAALTVSATLSFAWPQYWRAGGVSTERTLPVGTTPEGSPWIGAISPSVTIAVFMDYECPYCRLDYQRLRSVVARDPHRLRLVHKQFPLGHQCHPNVKRHFHRHACRFAVFTACAARQGRFWDAHDALLSALKTDKAGDVDLEPIASRLGLNTRLLRECSQGAVSSEAVQADIAEGIRLGVKGTPAYFVNGKPYAGKWNLKALNAWLAEPPPVAR